MGQNQTVLHGQNVNAVGKQAYMYTKQDFTSYLSLLVTFSHIKTIYSSIRVLLDLDG